jgi:NAD(P)-dependent dehydrogenase (short-subunit alcohol dehydrogenase family)
MKKLHELMDLQNRRVLITGATGMLGQIIADTMAELGASLLLVDQPESNFQPLCDMLSRHGGVALRCLPSDLELQEDRRRLADLVRDEGGLDVLINNAAFVGNRDMHGWAVPFEQQTLDAWRRAMEINLTAVFDLCSHFTKLLGGSGRGSIVNVGSIYGILGPNWGLYEGTGMANPAAYAASKGGLIQLTRWLATTLAPVIRVNSISPGGIFREQPDVFVKRYKALTPLGRMADEDDLRGAFAYFASDMSKYVTGQNLMVDGGWSAW